MVGRVAAVVIGLVFVLAGASKVAAGRSWDQQAAQLGSPTWVTPLLPWWELGLGALLVVGIGLPWTVVPAIVTLVAFTGLLLVHLRRGHRPPCACFGAWSAKPLGWGHVARNAAFLAVAALALTA